MPRHHDLVLYGATGFTGGLVAEYLAQRCRGTDLRWALAGRDRAKLERVRAGLVSGADDPALAELPIVLASSDDPVRLRAMAESTRLVLTTVGPYSVHGNPVVDACVAAGTDYVDITGEPGFWRGIIERHHERAAAEGIRIIPCCGFDSIPHDLGVMFAVSKLARRGHVHVQAYVAAFGDFSGGTWNSALHVLSDAASQFVRGLARRRRGGGGRADGSGRPRRRGIHFEREVGHWVAPLPTIDPLVVERSAALLGTYGDSFSYDHYFEAKDGLQLAGGVVGVAGLVVGSMLAPVRKRLGATRPPGTGPSEAARARHWFRVHVVARDDDSVVRAEVRGGDPGYDETAKMVSESALCALQDRDRLPPDTGVLTPAAGLGMPLLDRLQGRGMTFERIETARDPRPASRRGG